MNRRGFLRAVGAAGLWLLLHASAAAGTLPAERTRHGRIKAAIRDRRVLRFRYQDLLREVEPHAIGTVTGGRVALLAWQASGGSRSEPPPGWRTFIVADIRQLRVLKKAFKVRPEYRSGGGALKTVEAEAAP